MLPLYAALIMAAYIAIISVTERIAAVERPPLSARARGLLFSLLNVAGSLALVGAFFMLWGALGIHPLVSIELSAWLGIPAAIGASLLFSDFLNYWDHRAQHRFFWRIHRLHHSQTHLCAATAYAHPSERIVRTMLFVLPLSLINFDFPAIPFVIMTIRELLELYIHSPTDIHFGPLRRVLVDNRYHRIHHSLEPEHFDKNFGILFSFWDRIFGTLHEPAPNEWPAVGVANVAPPTSIADYLYFPLKRPVDEARTSDGALHAASEITR